MKNDFREFYDEDYIIHSSMENADEEELMHGEWANRLRKYIDKVKTASGKWRYIYPEDVKRDVSYGVRNAISKVTGKNRTFSKNANGPKTGNGHFEDTDGWAGHGTYWINTKERIRNNYANEQKKGQAGSKKYYNRMTPARSSSDQAYAFRNKNSKRPGVSGQSDYSIVMNNQERLAKKKAKNDSYKQDYAEKQKKAVRSAASKAQKAQIYGDYAAKQKKAVKSAASKAQKAQIYAHYDQMQKNKALGAAYRSARKQAHYDYKKKQAFYETDSAYGGNKKYKKYGTSPKRKMKK